MAIHANKGEVYPSDRRTTATRPESSAKAESHDGTKVHWFPHRHAPGHGTELIEVWSWQLVVVAYLISTLGALSGITVMEQRRMSHDPFNKRVLMILAGTVFGGVSLWGMDTIGTFAVQLQTKDGSETLPIKNRVQFRILTLVLAVLTFNISLNVRTSALLIYPGVEEYAIRGSLRSYLNSIT